MAAFRKLATSMSSECRNNVDPGEQTLDWSSDEGNDVSSVAENPAESDEESEEECDSEGSIWAPRKRRRLGQKAVVSCSEEEDLEKDSNKPISRKQQEALQETALPAKKGKGKSGPKAMWSTELLNDLVDIVANNESYKRKLIFTNIPKASNAEVYRNIVKDMNQTWFNQSFRRGVRTRKVSLLQMFEEAVLLGEKLGVTREEMHAIPRVVSQSRFRANAGGANQTAIEYNRINMFFHLLDEVVGDMQARFGLHQQKIATLSRILPSFVKETSWQDILPAVTKYASFLDPLSIVEGEYEIWKQQWQSCGASPVANTAIGALGNCQADVFPNVHTLLNILTALPVTTAEPERLFSKLNSTLTAIRSTMSEERLESLLLLQVHRERTPTTQKLIDSFAATKSRRLTLKL